MNPPLNPILVKDGAGLEQVKQFLTRTNEFGYDLETNIVPTFFNRRVRTMQIGDRNEQYVIDLLQFAQSTENLIAFQGHHFKHNKHSGLQAVVDTVRPALESNSHLKIGHNLDFDYKTSSWCLGLRPWHLYCTYLAEKVIHCGAVSFDIRGFWALDDLVARYCGLKLDKTEQKTFDLESELTENQIVYGALDVRILFALRNAQRKVMEKDGLLQAAQIEFDSLPAFGDMHITGMKIDGERWMGLVNDIVVKRENQIAELDKEFLPLVGEKGNPVNNLDELESIWRNTKDRTERKAAREVFMAARRKYKAQLKQVDTYEGSASINYASNPQLLVALRKMKGFTATTLPDTSDKTLSKLEHHPIIAKLQTFREYDKIISTYGQTFLEQYVDPDTGRIHSNIKQLGAATGRTSSSKPNVQNILKGADWRGCFVARPGKKIITIDYAGQELRIAADYSAEKSWIDAFNNGWDVHSVVADMLFGDEWTKGSEKNCAYASGFQKCKCKVHKDLRDNIKAISFGICYGLSARKLAGDLSITLEEAEALLQKYYKANPQLMAYLTKSGNDSSMKLESRTKSGRRRKYLKPTWEWAMRKAQERWGRLPTQKEIMRTYTGAFESIKRQGKNTPIQGTGVDCVKIAMSCQIDVVNRTTMLWHLLNDINKKYAEQGYTAELINMVHDEIVLEASEEIAEEVREVAENAMRRAGAQLITKVVMEVEGNVADRWKK